MSPSPLYGLFFTAFALAVFNLINAFDTPPLGLGPMYRTTTLQAAFAFALAGWIAFTAGWITKRQADRINRQEERIARLEDKVDGLRRQHGEAAR